MKNVFRICLTLGVFTLGIQARAEAVPSLSLRICQGLTCVNIGPNAGFVVSPPILVGDYLVSASGSFLETVTLSNSQTTSIQVQRVLSMNGGQALEIWLSSSGYILPVASDVDFFTTFGATSSAGAGPVAATYQGWYSNSNSGVVAGPPTGPPADGITAGPIGCVIGGGTTACSAVPGLVDVVTDGPLYALVTRTTFNILTTGAATYGSTAQANVVRDVTSVPEPASMVLLGTGLAGLAVRRHRRQR